MHANAFGISLPANRVNEFIEKTNELYSNISQEPVYWVDFIWSKNQIDPSIILRIAEAKDYWGQEMPEPYLVVKDIPLSHQDVQLLSPQKHPTIKVHLDNGVDIMKFKSSEEEFDDFSQPQATLTAVCRAAKNEWNGRVTAQLIIESYELKEEWIF